MTAQTKKLIYKCGMTTEPLEERIKITCKVEKTQPTPQ